MGSKFSKRQVVTKTKKTKTEKKQQGKSNSRNPGSTQSVNIYDSLVSSSPKQNNGNQYEDTQSLSGTSGNQRPVVLPEPGRSVVIPRTIQPPPPPAPCSPLPVVLPEPGRSVVIPRTIQPPPPAARIYKDLPDQACRIPRMPIKPPLLTNEQTQNPIKDVPEKESDYLAAKRNTQVSTSSETDDESNCIVTKTKPEISTDPQLYDDSNCIITETKPEIPTAPESDTDSDDYDYIHPGELSDRINIDVTKETDISEFHQPDCKQEMRADITSESNNESVIRDILQLIKDGEDKKSHFVKNLRTGEENFVPKAGFTKITKVDVKSLKCFFEKFDRQAAQERLLGSEIEIGTYLLRPSTDGYALSLRCKNKRFGIEIRHYKIRANDKGEFYIDAASNSKTFSNIVELISYYTENPGLRCNLKDPLPRDIPLSDFIVKFSDFELGKILGSGNFGYVHAAT